MNEPTAICAKCMHAVQFPGYTADIWRCKYGQYYSPWSKHITGKNDLVQRRCIDHNADGKCKNFERME